MAGSGADGVVFPESNADSVATNLWARTIDLDGNGLVDPLRVLLARAEEIKTSHSRAATFGRDIIAGRHIPEQDEFDGVLLEAWYETTCLKWFLARALKTLSEGLEYDVHQKQNTMRRIRCIVYGDEGDVESYALDEK